LSVVFQHWDTSYFATILESAAAHGAELKTAVTQTGDVIWSMHKKKNSASVLAGEMILTFYKPLHKTTTATTAPQESAPETASPQVLDDLFDGLLQKGQKEFTS